MLFENIQVDIPQPVDGARLLGLRFILVRKGGSRPSAAQGYFNEKLTETIDLTFISSPDVE